MWQTITSLFKKSWRLIKYGLGGAFATVFELAILYYLTERLSVWYVYSSIVAYGFGFLLSFILRKIWAFNDYDFSRAGRQLVVYIAILGFGLILNTAALVAMVEWFHIYYLLAQFLAGAVIGFIGFEISKKYVFKAGY